MTKTCTVLIGLLALLTSPAPVRAALNEPTGTMFYGSCMAAADIIEERPPAPEPDARFQRLEKAVMCMGAVTALMNLEPYFKAEFGMCPPKDSMISYAQTILVIAAFLRNHPEKLHQGFYFLAAVAVNEAWPCPN